MNFFKKKYTVRRYSKPMYIHGYPSVPYEDLTLLMDVQTMGNASVTAEDGSGAKQRLKVFCDFPLMTENTEEKQKADRLWFQGKWFSCQSSRLSENTPLRHYTATFIECLDKEDAPESGQSEESGIQEGAVEDDIGRSEEADL